MTTRLINTAKRATDKERLLTLPQLEKASRARALARAAKVLFGELKLVETYGCSKIPYLRLTAVSGVPGLRHLDAGDGSATPGAEEAMKANGGKLLKAGSSRPSSVWLPVPLPGHRQRDSSEHWSARARTCSSMARSPASGRHATRAAACGDHAAARAIAGPQLAGCRAARRRHPLPDGVLPSGYRPAAETDSRLRPRSGWSLSLADTFTRVGR